MVDTTIPSLWKNRWHQSYTSIGCKHGKVAALDPCSGLSESDPKLYTNSKIYETEIHKH